MDLSTVNSPWLFIWVAITIALVIVQCAVYMKKACNRALALGLEPQQIRKGLISGITISIIPTLPVLIVFLSLMPLLGIPLPWLRLSVIGSATYESLAASVGMQCVGEELAAGGYSMKGWLAAAWVMTSGGSASVLWSILAIKPISAAYSRAEKADMELGLAVGFGCLTGVMAYVSTYFGFSALSTKGVVFLISFCVGALLILIRKKYPRQNWLSEYLIAISMIVAMVGACLIF